MTLYDTDWSANPVGVGVPAGWTEHGLVSGRVSKVANWAIVADASNPIGSGKVLQLATTGDLLAPGPALSLDALGTEIWANALLLVKCSQPTAFTPLAFRLGPPADPTTYANALGVAVRLDGINHTLSAASSAGDGMNLDPGQTGTLRPVPDLTSWFWVRAQVDASTISFRHWPVGGPEPSWWEAILPFGFGSWTSQLSPGGAGIGAENRASASGAVSVGYAAFATGLASPPVPDALVVTADTLPPNAPTGFTAVQDGSTGLVVASWQPAYDAYDQTVVYIVSESGRLIYRGPKSTATLGDFTAGNHTITLTAADSAGNVGPGVNFTLTTTAAANSAAVGRPGRIRI